MGIGSSSFDFSSCSALRSCPYVDGIRNRIVEVVLASPPHKHSGSCSRGDEMSSMTALLDMCWSPSGGCGLTFHANLTRTNGSSVRLEPRQVQMVSLASKTWAREPVPAKLGTPRLLLFCVVLFFFTISPVDALITLGRSLNMAHGMAVEDGVLVGHPTPLPKPRTDIFGLERKPD